MANKLDLQMKLLKELRGYSGNLIKGKDVLVAALREGRSKHTDELFDSVIAGINWVIEVFNCCEPLINEEQILVDKVQMTASVKKLGEALQKKDDAVTADCLETYFRPFLFAMWKAADVILD